MEQSEARAGRRVIVENLSFEVESRRHTQFARQPVGSGGTLISPVSGTQGTFWLVRHLSSIARLVPYHVGELTTDPFTVVQGTFGDWRRPDHESARQRRRAEPALTTSQPIHESTRRRLLTQTEPAVPQPVHESTRRRLLPQTELAAQLSDQAYQTMADDAMRNELRIGIRLARERLMTYTSDLIDAEREVSRVRMSVEHTQAEIAGLEARLNALNRISETAPPVATKPPDEPFERFLDI